MVHLNVRLNVLPSAMQDGAKCLASSQHASRKEIRRFRRAPGSLSRNSNPYPRHSRGVAHLFLMRNPHHLVIGILRRTVEASRPEWANPPARSSGFLIFAPGAPSALRNLARGSLSGRSSISGRFRRQNLVVLEPQSKCFFSYLQCGSFMALAAGPGRGRHRPDPAAAARPVRGRHRA